MGRGVQLFGADSAEYAFVVVLLLTVKLLRRLEILRLSIIFQMQCTSTIMIKRGLGSLSASRDEQAVNATHLTTSIPSLPTGP